MLITLCTKADFDQILTDNTVFWGSDRVRHLHHPSLLYEFGDTAFVIKEEETVVAYLFGYFAQNAPTAYVHLIGIRPSHRRRGLARHLYTHLLDLARARGCTAVKAITTPTNADSIAFHR